VWCLRGGGGVGGGLFFFFFLFFFWGFVLLVFRVSGERELEFLQDPWRTQGFQVYPNPCQPSLAFSPFGFRFCSVSTPTCASSPPT